MAFFDPSMPASSAPSFTPNSALSFRIDARWVITMNAANDVLERHSLIVENGRITDCLPWPVAEEQYSHLAVQDQRNGILLPGLINAHTHLAMNLLRGFADDTPLEEWLREHIWPTEAAHMGRDFVREGTELALAESLLNGVTTVNDMYFFPDEVAKTCRNVGMRATVGLLVFDFPTAWANNIDEYFSRGLSLHDELKEDPLISTAFAPHAPYTVSQGPLERIATLAAELDIPIHMHVHETAAEVKQFRKNHGVRPLQRLDEIGLLSPSLLAVHLTQLTEDEIHRLSETGVNVIHCPESNLKLASGICRITDLLAADVNIAVGTDSAASNNDLDLIGELRTATFLAKVTSGNATTLDACTALRMITINAAKALGLDREIGSLEAGKSADFIVIQPDLGMVPVYDALAQVVYTNSSPCVSDVWIAGKQLLRNRQLLTLDADRLHRNAQVWSHKISENAKQP
ncbi:MAG: 5-methylthioadenosine/S-adenosylhomocysteine deaminase [Granulosicoccus sp.]|jgi:5-methylthioadenosine/S-adenosylhomocysteine deaminase